MHQEGKAINGQTAYVRNANGMRSIRLVQPQPATPSYRLRKLTLLVLGICALVWLWQQCVNPRTFPIRNVQISGDYHHVDHAKLRQIILPYLKKGIVELDVAGLQDSLEQLPWVDTVAIKHAWPSTVKIIIHEQQPVARFGSTGLVNQQGNLFTVDAATIPANLPLFMGMAGQQKIMLDNYTRMTAVLAPLGLTIKTLSLNARESWSLQLNNGIVLWVGMTDPIARLQRFAQVYSQIVGNKVDQIYSVDLRYANGVAVRYQ